MRANLLASATAASFGGLRLRSCSTHAESMLRPLPFRRCLMGRSDHQCAAQALVPSSRNDAEPYLTGGRMIFWRQPDPGCELPTRSKHLGRRRLHDEHRCADRADPGDLSKAPATWVGFVPGHEFPLDLIDLRLQLRIFLGVSREELSSQVGEAFIGLNASEQGSEVSNPLGGGQTELCRIASDRIGELGAITNQPIA